MKATITVVASEPADAAGRRVGRARVVLRRRGPARGCGGGGGGGGGSSAYHQPKGPATETLAIEAGNFYFKPDTITGHAGHRRDQARRRKGGIHTLVFDGAYRGLPARGRRRR